MSDKYQARKTESSWLEADSSAPCSSLGPVTTSSDWRRSWYRFVAFGESTGP